MAKSTIESVQYATDYELSSGLKKGSWKTAVGDVLYPQQLPSNVAKTLEITHHSTFVPVGSMKPIPMRQCRARDNVTAFS